MSIENNDEKTDCVASESCKSGDWKTAIQTMLDEMISDKRLPEKSLYLSANYGRDGQTITSYTLGIYEPDYPLDPNAPEDSKRNSIVINVKEARGGFELLISAAAFESVGACQGADVRRGKAQSANSCVLFIPDDLAVFVPYVQKVMDYALANYKSKASPFGCCDKFNKCSDLKHCVHDNLLFSKACIYRSNLDAGRIFYGKNRNID